MSRYIFHILAVCLLCATLACNAATAADESVANIPDPALDAPLATARGERTVVLAGGCFWGIEAVFEHVKGVNNVVSGYAGGTAKTASYEVVSAGESGHAEAVRITYDPSQITYGRLLKIFFSVAHDPTQLNRQGPDTGTQYRSAIFYADAEQKRIAESYVKQLNDAKVFGRQIVTQVAALDAFYEAEPYHQDYAAHHPDQPYIKAHDLPKVENLRKQFPDLYVVRSSKERQ
ncbi:MAG TPA: peptide-methionine (S)-S-oxide reductase MsrA [Pyrinomonadaceae bacterium]|nr:peptide-methionine (S)-S-oxide reductase MsrA [Pyrinomonadaceae bacterium]